MLTNKRGKLRMLSFAHSFLDLHSLRHSKCKSRPRCCRSSCSLCYNVIEKATNSGIQYESTRIATPPSRNNSCHYHYAKHTLFFTGLTLDIMLSCAYKVSYFVFSQKLYSKSYPHAILSSNF